MTGVDTHNVELGLHRRARPAIATRQHWRPTQQPVGEAQTHRQFEVMTGCAHRGANKMTVEADLEGFLDDEFIRSPTRLSGRIDSGIHTNCDTSSDTYAPGENRLGSSSGHGAHRSDPERATGRPDGHPVERTDLLDQ